MILIQDIVYPVLLCANHVQYPEEMCFGIKKECINYDSEIENLANYISEYMVKNLFLL